MPLECRRRRGAHLAAPKLHSKLKLKPSPAAVTHHYMLLGSSSTHSGVSSTALGCSCLLHSCGASLDQAFDTALMLWAASFMRSFRRCSPAKHPC